MTSGDVERVESVFADATQTRTGWLRAVCPFCFERVGKQDKRRSLSILPGRWFYRCWRCHISGVLPRAPEGGAHLELPERDPSQFDLGPPEGFMPLATEPAASALVTREARAYLEGRGVAPSVWAEAGVGVSLHGFAAQRIVVPVTDPGSGDWFGWVGRAWDRDCELRYRYPPGMERGLCLFNAGALAVRTSTPALIVEGVFDALPHWPHAVACLGKPTEAQIEIMREAARPILVALDGDAWSEGEALALRLQLEGVSATSVRLPPCTDPGDFAYDELMALTRLLAPGAEA